MAKKPTHKAEKSVRILQSIGNIPDCKTLDDVTRRFDDDAKRWEGETDDSEALDLAVAYWLGYPAFYANVDFLYDGDIAERRHAKTALDRTHHLATEYLMAQAERHGINSGPLMESAMLCRAMLADKDNARLCYGKGIWPDCLANYLKTLADGQWEIAQRGYAALARLSAKIRPSSPAKSEIAKPVTLTPEATAILGALERESPTTMTQEALADVTQLSGPTVHKNLEFLREHGLTHRPHGPRKGEAITPEGLSLIRQG